MNINKVLDFLHHYQKMASGGDEYNIGLCHLALMNYREAQAVFKESISILIAQPNLWVFMGRPSLLVDLMVLSGKIELIDAITELVDSYSENKGGRLLTVSYSYVLLELIRPNGGDISHHLETLLEKPRYIIYYYSIGSALKAIIENDNNVFSNSLERVISIHHGMAKHGMLRESPEGLICLPAMTLVYAAMTRGILVNINSEYISIEYLKYIYPKSPDNGRF